MWEPWQVTWGSLGLWGSQVLNLFPVLPPARLLPPFSPCPSNPLMLAPGGGLKFTSLI